MRGGLGGAKEEAKSREGRRPGLSGREPMGGSLRESFNEFEEEERRGEGATSAGEHPPPEQEGVIGLGSSI